MSGFRRAQLQGSDELFRTTEPQTVAADQPDLVPPPTPVPNAPSAGSRSLRLEASEIALLAESLQHLKFPAKQPPKPSMEEFETLEALRQKLLGHIDHN